VQLTSQSRSVRYVTVKLMFSIIGLAEMLFISLHIELLGPVVEAFEKGRHGILLAAFKTRNK
jgi:hypothetical protein